MSRRVRKQLSQLFTGTSDSIKERMAIMDGYEPGSESSEVRSDQQHTALVPKRPALGEALKKLSLRSRHGLPTPDSSEDSGEVFPGPSQGHRLIKKASFRGQVSSLRKRSMNALGHLNQRTSSTDIEPRSSVEASIPIKPMVPRPARIPAPELRVHVPSGDLRDRTKQRESEMAALEDYCISLAGTREQINQEIKTNAETIEMPTMGPREWWNLPKSKRGLFYGRARTPSPVHDPAAACNESSSTVEIITQGEEAVKDVSSSSNLNEGEMEDVREKSGELATVALPQAKEYTTAGCLYSMEANDRPAGTLKQEGLDCLVDSDVEDVACRFALRLPSPYPYLRANPEQSDEEEQPLESMVRRRLRERRMVNYSKFMLNNGNEISNPCNGLYAQPGLQLHPVEPRSPVSPGRVILTDRLANDPVDPRSVVSPGRIVLTERLAKLATSALDNVPGTKGIEADGAELSDDVSLASGMATPSSASTESLHTLEKDVSRCEDGRTVKLPVVVTPFKAPYESSGGESEVERSGSPQKRKRPSDPRTRIPAIKFRRGIDYSPRGNASPLSATQLRRHQTYWENRENMWQPIQSQRF